MEDISKPATATDKRPFRPKNLTTEDIRAGCIKLYGADGTEAQVCVMGEELRQGLDFMQAVEKSVTIFGSARTPETNEHYQRARRIAQRIVQETGAAVVTGGGPGIMQAGNQGAFEVNGRSIGMQIILPHEQVTNPYLTDMLPFYFFFTRKTVMRFASEVYLFFPGGYGTLDELMESLTLVQTKKTAPVPIILVGTEFWKPLDDFIKNSLRTDHLISEFDPSLYIITDDEDVIIEVIKTAPVRKEY